MRIRLIDFGALGSRLSASGFEHLSRALLGGEQRVVEPLACALERVLIGVARHVERFTDADRNGRKRLRDLRAVPASKRPRPIGLAVERQHGVARRLRQPYGAGLRDARGTARPVDRESRRPASLEIA
jgi:hypothetical protein